MDEDASFIWDVCLLDKDLKEQIENYKNAISEIKKQVIQYDTEIEAFGEKIKTIVANKTSEFPDLCMQLEENGIEIKQQYDELKVILEDAQFSWNRLNLLNKNKERVYSCSMDWNIISNIQAQIADLQREITAKQDNILLNSTQINSLMLQMGN